MKKTAVLISLLFTIAFAYPQHMHRERPAEAEYNKLLKTLDGKSVGDFTVTDSDGVVWNLYTLLDAGNTIILDLFQST